MKRGDFSVVQVISKKELDLVWQMRYEGEYWKYWEEQNHKTKEEFFTNENKKDDSATLLIIKDGEKVIASIRAIATGRNLTTTEEIIKDLGVDNNFLQEALELGRFIVKPENRGQKSLSYSLYLALKWLMDNKNIKYAFAHCPYKLARIYREFGFEIISQKFAIPYSTQEYVIIFGELQKIIKKLDEIILSKYTL